jgi:hypothetical protein
VHFTCEVRFDPETTLHISFFLRLSVFKPKRVSSIGRCRKSGDHPYEEIAKSGYEPNMKLKIFNYPTIFFLHIERQV